MISTVNEDSLEYLHILLNAAGATGYLHAKDQSWSPPYTTHKNEPRKKKNHSCKSFVNFRLDDDFLRKMSDAQETKGKKSKVL